MSWRIEDKRILVTGGTTGIGRATALALAARGACVTITSRDLERGAAAARELTRASGRTVDNLALDLADLHHVEEAARAFADRTGGLDVLINNAGAFFAPRRDSAQGIEATMAVNHLGPFCLTGLLLPLLKSAGSGRIIVVASEAHRSALGPPHLQPTAVSDPDNPFRAYAASKLANILFARALSQRLDRCGITVNSGAVAPWLAPFSCRRHRPAPRRPGFGGVGLRSSLERHKRCLFRRRPSGHAPQGAILRRLR
jgi:NAD(P)-dependent dehydrogenase (short-subunit alcohol dehydrogenase family)